jgi:hypothetical protein
MIPSVRWYDGEREILFLKLLTKTTQYLYSRLASPGLEHESPPHSSGGKLPKFLALRLIFHTAHTYKTLKKHKILFDINNKIRIFVYKWREVGGSGGASQTINVAKNE